MNDIQILMWMVGGGFSLMIIMWVSLTKRIDRLEDKVDKLGALETRMAVVESKLSDISTNVTHLMWQHQVPRESRDVQEQ